MENNHYIYFHINPVKNEVFYVGQGVDNRAKSKKSRTDLWKNIVNKYGYIIDIIESNLTKEQVNEREKFYIKKIGRRDLGLGPLVNFTDGGEGSTGYKHTEEAKKKNSELKKGHKYMLGFKHSEISKEKFRNRTYSEETRKKMRDAKLGKKASDETKEKMRIAHTGSTNKSKGKPWSEKRRLAQQNKIKNK